MTARHLIAATLGFVLCAPVAWAQPGAALDRLWAALEIPKALDIMRDEGLDMAEEVAVQYLGNTASDLWVRDITAIYEPETMAQVMRDGFSADLDGTEMEPLLDFFTSERGTQIITLEMTARRAFLDPDTEAAARDLIAAGDADPELLDLVDRFITVNDLVDYNTSGAMNTNVAFLKGLSQSEVFLMTEQEILDQVWNDAEGNRAETEDWLRAFLYTAYSPLDPEDLRAYIAFSESRPGQRLNRALFAGFGEMYNQQYHALGLAVARQLAGQDL